MFDFIVQLIAETGYTGVFLLMMFENIFPPLHSELIMPFAGFSASRGELNAIGVVLAGTAGSVAGAMPWYFAGKWIGRERLCAWAGKHGRWLTLSAAELDKALSAFTRHDMPVLIFGRLVPAIRTLISVPAGVAGIALLPFLAYSAGGSLLWVCALTGAGYVLQENFEAVASYVDPVATALVALAVLTYLYRLVQFRSSR
ncbi:DedA family protein [Massilia genomosp. 1]|uniref:DedA family protein n=1 Tax=Massilia genomosp. 1 TaxID=2609280 RepID=A0ABX0MTJ4_9BURK|nr:DedA family protein [Massilia genomosp. 1]NHZ63348.1 DedA family protein [Massilia genomosp. 1]